MFSLAYVILPFSEAAPADAITRSLARFRRGERGDVPDEWLRFADKTAEVRAAHETRFTFTRGQGRSLGTEGGVNWLLDLSPILDEMERRGTERWQVRFADLEPDIARFATRFVRPLERHPVTGGFGHWLNGLGRWDWWDLGGRFDGAISGGRRQQGRTRSDVSSGPSQGRAVLANLENAFRDALDQPAPPHIDVRMDNNVELIVTLRDDLRSDGAIRLPHTLVLPQSLCAVELRWIGTWPELGPLDAVDALGLPAQREWRTIVEAVYDRFADHWAAGVAYHH